MRRNKNYISFLSIYLLMLPLNAVNIGSFGSLLKIFAFLPCLIGLLHISKNKKSSYLLLYFIYVVISFFSVFWSNYTSISFTTVKSLAMLFLLLLSGNAFEYTQNDLLKIKKVLWWSSRLSAIVLLLFGTYREGRLWLTGAFIEDPNYFCMYLSFGILGAFQSLLNKKKFFIKLLYLIEFFSYLAITLLTGSRGGLLALLVGLIAYVLFEKKGNISIKIFAVFIVFIGLYYGASFLSQEIVNRFTFDSIIASGGSNRIDIWKQGIDLFKKTSIMKKIFGFGISTIHYEFAANGYLYHNVMHNMFFQTLLDTGIVGLVTYIIMIFTFFIGAFKINDKFSFGVFIMMFTMSLSTSIVAFKPYIHIMLYIICNSREITLKEYA